MKSIRAAPVRKRTMWPKSRVLTGAARRHRRSIFNFPMAPPRPKATARRFQSPFLIFASLGRLQRDNGDGLAAGDTLVCISQRARDSVLPARSFWCEACGGNPRREIDGRVHTQHERGRRPQRRIGGGSHLRHPENYSSSEYASLPTIAPSSFRNPTRSACIPPTATYRR